MTFSPSFMVFRIRQKLTRFISAKHLFHATKLYLKFFSGALHLPQSGSAPKRVCVCCSDKWELYGIVFFPATLSNQQKEKIRRT